MVVAVSQLGGKKIQLRYPILIVFLTTSYYVLSGGTASFRAFAIMFIIGMPCMIIYFDRCFMRHRPFVLFFKIENIIVLLSALGGLLWIAGPLLGVLSTNTTITIDWGGFKTIEGYFNLLYESQQADTSFTESRIVRNCLIFTEGPMYNLWVSHSLFVEFFFRPKKSLARVTILLFSLITIFSTTAYLGILLFVGFYLLKKFFCSNHKYWYLFVVLSFLPLIIYVSLLLLENKAEANALSYDTRLNDYVVGYLLWQSNPIFGTGYANVDDLFLGGDRTEMGFSNSSLAILATGGIWMMTIVFYPIFRCIGIGYHNKVYHMLFYALFLLYLLTVAIFFARFALAVFIAFLYAISNLTLKNLK